MNTYIVELYKNDNLVEPVGLYEAKDTNELNKILKSEINIYGELRDLGNYYKFEVSDSDYYFIVGLYEYHINNL